MPTPREIAAEYIPRIHGASDIQREIRRQIDELNSLPHLTREDRLLVVDLVFAAFGPRPPGEMGTYLPQPRSGDNARTLDLIRAIRVLIK